VPDGCNGPRVGLSEQGLEFGKDLLHRVDVGAAGRQEQRMRTGCADGSAHHKAFVAAAIIEHDDVAGRQCRHEDLDHPGEENGAIDRTVDDAGCGDAACPQPGQEGHRRPTAMRHACDQAPTPRRATGLGSQVAVAGCRCIHVATIEAPTPNSSVTASV
jgi:hypothetical protein